MNRSRRYLCVAALAGAGQSLLGRLSVAQDAPSSNPRIIQVTARKFQFSPNPIHLRKGESVVLEVMAVDFMHGFNIPDLKMRIDLAPGRITRIPLMFEKAGTYDFLCDNFCGSGHEEMNGKLIVAA
ncbi:cupredoxin domain-containing protein [Noviherbaspirillum galbum]|uniref:Cytochrome c oxidase subunit II n=1 Tax=Noviherbaspirillum galbum TaxID=2709383 RepID=A0A6B3SZM0_9BURK|nr:cupredoxin domain-containing protein [Noviherbaspirillum galbum]NEX64882.1 cytochrome c oxidase subunit II [Noviherbaspirillum galbum]